MNKQIILAVSSVRILEENNKTMSLQELNGQKDLLKRQFFSEKIETLTAAYKTENYGLANELLQEMEREEGLSKAYSHLDPEPFMAYLSLIWGGTFVAAGYTGLLGQLRENIQNSLRREHGGKQDIIQQVKEYVAANYMNDVSIAEIGSRFDISPSYISRIFREKTGEKYIDFVTSVRMNRAMELLRANASLSVREVAERVGYISEKHFSKTFKKYFDCLPSQVDKA